MKWIGIIGGMSWESSLEYYRLLNEEVKKRLGGLHSAKVILLSLDFEEIERLQHQDRWEELARIMVDSARRLERAGADFLLLATNTMHKVAEFIEKSVSIPLLHIVDATADEIKKQGLKKVGLMGTRFTMEQEFYRNRFEERHSIAVVIPDMGDREIIHRVIYEELCAGEIKESSREKFREIIGRLKRKGAEGVVLGCTEIPLLVKQKHVDIPVFDTTAIHVKAAVDYALR